MLLRSLGPALRCVVLALGLFVVLGLSAGTLGGRGEVSVDFADKGTAGRTGGSEDVVPEGLVDAVRRLEYHITPVFGEGCFAAPNRVQGLLFELDGKGFGVQPREQGPGWWYRMEVGSIGRGSGIAHYPRDDPEFRYEEAQLEVDHGTFVMMYENGPLGLRQDFLVRERAEGNGPIEVRLCVQGSLVAQLDAIGDVYFRDPQQEDRPFVHYKGLQAWDAMGTPLPAWAFVEEGVVVLSVDDGSAVYPITIDPLSATADALLEADQPGARFAHAVSSAGDVNGDGYSDIIIGAPLFDNGSGEAGRVFVYYGSAMGVQGPPQVIEGGQVGAFFGYAVSTAGDVNGDGYGDVIIGAPYHGSAHAEEGAAWVYLGSAGGLDPVPHWVVYGEQSEARMGWSVSLAGDVDGDGYSEVLVGAPYYDHDHTDEGRAFLFHGSALGLVAVPGWVVEGGEEGARMGWSVSGAGDVNGDGYGDVILGAPFLGNGQSEEGMAFVYHGSAAGLSLSPAWTQESDQIGAHMGWSVSAAGDLNGDGYADVIVGAPDYTLAGRVSQGRVYVTYGSASGIAGASWISFGGLFFTEARFGVSVASAGDVNGDGYSDVIIGARGASGGGRVTVFQGGATGLGSTTAANWSTVSVQAGADHGASVSSAGDVNGDGYSDIVLGAPLYDNGETDEGVAFVHHGGTQGLASFAGWSATLSNGAGGSVVSAGDVNGDGYNDVIVGSLGNGGWVRVFHGSAVGLPATANWTSTAGGYFGHSVSSAGDVNGDGYSDVLVGRHGSGQVYVFHGSPSGLSFIPDRILSGGGDFGFSVSTAGDVNGDGYSDVVVGKPGAGEAYVFHGSSAGLSTTANLVLSFGGDFGYSVAFAGDVNGDGYDDVVFGAPQQGVGGAAYVFHGSATGLENSPAWQRAGSGGQQLGYSVSTAGDVNGDGVSDVIIGSPMYRDEDEESVGAALVYLGANGAGLSVVPAWQVEGVFPGYTFGPPRVGWSVSAAGDVNGDGYGDVIVGAAWFGHSPAYIGQAQVWHGSPSGLAPTPEWVVTGPATNDRLGWSVSAAGDVNGDGYGDVIVGAPGASPTDNGKVFLYFGNGGRGLVRGARQYRSDQNTPVQTGNGAFGLDCSWGVGQVARWHAGRGKVRLVWEKKGHGVPFSGSPITNNTMYSGASSGWVDIGTAGVEIKEVLTAIPLASGFPSWRVRLQYHPASTLDGQPFSRWFYPGINDKQTPSIKVHENCGPLPVEFGLFEGVCNAGNAELEWATFSEQDNAYFRVERSVDAREWEQAGEVPGAGSSVVHREYQWRDPEPLHGRSIYYRVIQVGMDDSETMLTTTVVHPCTFGRTELIVSPNPSKGMLEVRLPPMRDTAGELWVLSLAGTELMHQEFSGRSEERIGMDLRRLAQGMYILQVRTADGLVVGTARVVLKH